MILCLNIAEHQRKCSACGKEKDKRRFHGKLCYECFAAEKNDERDNMTEEEAALDEFFAEHLQTPETPSSSHFSSASSSSSSSTTATGHSSAHGKVCNAHICPSQMLLLMNLHVFCLLAIVFAVVPMGANAGAMPAQRLRAPSPSRTPWAAPLLLGACGGQIFEPGPFLLFFFVA